MSEDELQETQEVELDTGEEVVEEPEKKEPEVPEGFISVEQNQHEVNKQFKFRKEAERAAETAKQEAERLKQELEDIKAKAVDLTVPPVPDPYSDDYEAKIRERDEALRLQAAHDAQIQQNEAAMQRNAEQAKRDAEAEQVRLVEDFNANVIKQGFDQGKIAQAAQKVVEYGVSEVLEDIILKDSIGGPMTQYLADNPVELDALNNMSGYDLMNAIPALKQKAEIYKPQTSKAPPPPEILDGGGGGEIENPALKGVIFE